jgi:hypothetical protein
VEGGNLSSHAAEDATIAEKSGHLSWPGTSILKLVDLPSGTDSTLSL